MKYIYIDHHLATLLLDAHMREHPQTWLYSQGRQWLLLTPARLRRLAEQVGSGDERLGKIIRLIRRYGKEPGAFCRRLGIDAAEYYSPEQYPSVLCPRCDGVHFPHPEEAMRICRECRQREHDTRGKELAGGRKRDRWLDALARDRLEETDPGEFYQGRLMPNHQYNLHRILHRDWDAAINKILMGRSYKQVAKEYDCSVGLLHKKVSERHWENN